MGASMGRNRGSRGGSPRRGGYGGGGGGGGWDGYDGYDGMEGYPGYPAYPAYPPQVYPQQQGGRRRSRRNSAHYGDPAMMPQHPMMMPAQPMMPAQAGMMPVAPMMAQQPMVAPGGTQQFSRGDWYKGACENMSTTQPPAMGYGGGYGPMVAQPTVLQMPPVVLQQPVVQPVAMPMATWQASGYQATNACPAGQVLVTETVQPLTTTYANRPATTTQCIVQPPPFLGNPVMNNQAATMPPMMPPHMHNPLPLPPPNMMMPPPGGPNMCPPPAMCPGPYPIYQQNAFPPRPAPVAPTRIVEYPAVPLTSRPTY